MALSSVSGKMTRISAWVVIVLTVCGILPFIYISRYVHPVNDDFAFALQHMDAGVIQSVIDSYRHWSGRYFATTLSALNPYAWSDTPLQLLRIYSAVLAVLLPIVSLIGSAILTGRYIGKLCSVALGALFMLTFLGLCPSTGELLYWFSSYTAYTSGVLLSVIFFSILPKNSLPIAIVQCIMAILIVGTNEVTAVLLTTTLIYLTYTYRSKRLASIMLCALAAIIVVMLSPGNGIRMTHRLSAHPYLWTVVISLGQSVSWLMLWVPALLAATPLYILLGGLKLARLPIFDTSFPKYIIFATVATILAHVPAAYGLGSVIIGRTANCLLFFFILFYFYGINILLHKRSLSVEDAIKAIGGGHALSVLSGGALWCYLFLVPFNINSPVTTAFTDIISGKAAGYDRIQSERLAIARGHNHTGEVCCLPTFGVTSRTLFIKDLESDPEGEFATNFCKIHNLNCRVFVPEGEVYFENNFDTLKNIGKNNR